MSLFQVHRQRQPAGTLRDVLFSNGERASSSFTPPPPPYSEDDLTSVVEYVTMISADGQFAVTVCNLGATVTSIRVPNVGEIVQQPPSSSWLTDSVYYAGRTCGRLAGRAAPYSVCGHQSQNHHHPVHGGRVGFSHRMWKLTNTFASSNSARACFELDSAHMEEGHPGAVRVEAHFECTTAAADGGATAPTLSIRFRARLLESSPCPVACVNLTSHVYFKLPSSSTPTLSLHLPRATSYIANHFDETPTPICTDSSFDFNSQPRPLVDLAKACIDHCFVLDDEDDEDDSSSLGIAAVLANAHMRMVVRSSLPAVVVYTNGELDAVCLETQFPPNCVNMRLYPRMQERITVSRRPFDANGAASSSVPYDYDEVTRHEFHT